MRGQGGRFSSERATKCCPLTAAPRLSLPSGVRLGGKSLVNGHNRRNEAAFALRAWQWEESN